MNEQFTVPVVIIVFNRPDSTKQLIDKLSIIKPSKIYVIADGPRKTIVGDQDLCAKTRNAIDQGINWNCEIKKDYSENNLGCGIRISTGLNWVFENEENAIILEDDCIPAISFFSFCEELLSKYKNDSRVMHICGSLWNTERIRPELSYFYSKYSHISGWATWKRAWDLYDYELKTWPLVKSGNYLSCLFETKKEMVHFNKIFETYYQTSEKSGWATQWFYTVLTNNGVAVVPNSNLINNIGEVGTHSSDISYLYNRPVDEDFKIMNHPKIFVVDKWFDNYHSTKHILRRNNLIIRIRNYLKRSLFRTL